MIFFFFFFGNLAVSRNDEKQKKKKKRCRGDWMGYCPFSSLGHDTTDCIVTQLGGRAIGGHDTSSQGLRHGRPARGWPGLSGSRYKFCIMTGGRPLVSRYDAARLRSVAASTEAHAAWTFVSQYNFVSRQGACDTVHYTARDTACYTASVRNDPHQIIQVFNQV